MRKTSVCIMTLALLLCAVAVFAAPAASTTAAPAASSTTAATTGTTATTTTTTTTKKASSCKGGSGEVSAKDDTAKTITVHPKTGSDMTFTTNDKTTYWMGKKKATWADIATGQTAHVACTMDGTNMVASKVRLAAPKATATPK
jgi:hypothetical protein